MTIELERENDLGEPTSTVLVRVLISGTSFDYGHWTGDFDILSARDEETGEPVELTFAEQDLVEKRAWERWMAERRG